MSFRTRHLACLFLLLSSLGVAQGEGSPVPSHHFTATRLEALLYRHAAHTAKANAAARAEHGEQQNSVISAQLPQASRATYRTAWTMRAPAAHTASLQAITAYPDTPAL